MAARYQLCAVGTRAGGRLEGNVVLVALYRKEFSCELVSTGLNIGEESQAVPGGLNGGTSLSLFAWK